MATLIGTVSKVIGQVYAVAGDGTRRALIEGDRLFAGEQLVTGAEGAVAVHLHNGQELTLGRDSSLQMTAQLLAHQVPHVETADAVTPSQAQLTDVEQLQKAIAAGADPTQTAEATAAGPDATGAPGGALGGGHSFVLLEEVGGRVDPTIGFPTAGFNGIPEFPLERRDAAPDNGNNGIAAPVVTDVPNNPVTLTGLSVAGGELTLNEANLADGSASNPGALTQNSTFTVSAPDGLTSLSIGGISVISGGVPIGFPQSITTQLGNALTITGYNPATGVVSYSYTLVGNEIHSAGDGTNSLSEQFTVVASDSNGDTATGSLDVNITDDVPRAIDDTNAHTASETLLTLTGSVLPNDIQGADRIPTGPDSGPIIGGTFTGTYGTLVLNANGTYTYTLNTSDADFKALHGGGNGTENFVYTLTDADGDTSTATLVLNIHNNDDLVTLNGLNAEGGELIVNEKNLSDGSSPDASALTQSGTFTITALDGVQTLTVGGIVVVSGGLITGFPHSIVTPLGNTLTITGYDNATGMVSYSYTLVDNEMHPNANGANSLSEQFAVTVVDDNGTTANGSLDVNIVDDLPQAVDDSNAHAASETLLTLSGNVLPNDVQGADRVTTGENAGPITPGTFAGTYGTLVLNANGTYTYTLNTSDADFKALQGGGNGTEHFVYTLTDADGDTSTATLVLNIHNNDDLVTLDGLNVNGGELTVYEKNLSDGSSPDAPALTQSGTFTVTALDGLQTLTVGGIAVVTGGVAAGFPQSIVTPLGSTLTITGYDSATGVVSYSYTLVDNETHPNAGGANSITENLNVVATDVDGSTALGQINVNIVDDLPTAHPDHVSVAEGATVSGNVLGNDIGGADGPALGGAVVGVRAGSDTSTSAVGGLNTQINGTYGYLTLDANGNAVYHSNPNSVGEPGATDVFTYTVRDGDGDESTTTITIDVSNCTLVATTDTDVTAYEKALDLTKDGQDLAAGTVIGSEPDNTGETASGTLVGSVTGATGAITYTLVGSATGTYGQILLNPDGSYTYTLTSAPTTTPHANDGANTLSESFTYQATDALGNSVTSTIVINIVDDVPTAHCDSVSVVEGGTVSGNVLDNDVLGADGPALGGAVVGVRAGSDTSTSAIGGLNTHINGTYGYLTLDANGNAVYHSNPNSVGEAGATDVFTYTVRDADGDESTATITVDVSNSCLVAATDTDVTVYEKALDLTKDGQDLAAGSVTGSEPGNTGETGSGTLTGSVTGATGAITYTLVGSATGTYGQILLNPDGSYTYTLTSAPKTSPNANDDANTLNESFTYKATDALGNSTTGTLVVNIVDDVPHAVASDRSVPAVQIDSNLMLVIDVSGSMDDPSGVSGLSRLDLAKQAISALLDKYDNLGDVKVQIVTFSSSATDQTSVWVDVATAKSIIATLTAGGGTNYDAAVATMESAFDTSGKLTGAQNVGYFFSDGKPNEGDIGTADEIALKAFLDANGIKNYAIGLGSGVNNASLDPVAYDGSTHTDTNAVVVTDLNQLNSVLSGTVQGAPVTGSLLGEGGTFGADGGFIKILAVDGTTYTYDPKANSNQGSLNFSGGANHGTFNTADNTLSIATNNSGTLLVNLDTGEYSYTSQKTTAVQITENIGFTASDNDGDLTSSTLTVNVIPNSPPVAVDDHIITNVLSGSIVVPGELLLANDTDPNGDVLTASPTTFNTGWVAKGADFTGINSSFSFTGNNVQAVTIARSAFVANTAAMTAMLVVSGALGAVSTNNTNDEDRITVNLKQGETLNLDHNLAAGHITLEYSVNGGAFIAIADGQTITATADGTYQIHITNIDDGGPGNSGKGAENYQLTMTVNYAGAQDSTPDFHGTYTTSDNHGGSDSAAVNITYQDGHTLTGTSGDDVLIAGTGNNVINAGDGNDLLTGGSGNNELHGGAGNDLLFSGPGNDWLDGGTGNDTASYAHATAGVTVNLSLLTAQNTVGAGTDTLTGIENLTGSNFNDSLTGDNNSNVINGGLGNDALNGGGGDDLLIGGPGDNTLTGGSGADTFQWFKGNSGHDVITDFTPGTDKLDLSQLLQGENGTAASLDDYLHFKVTGSGASLVTSIDVSAMAGATPSQTIDLAGVNLASHYGVTPGAGGVVAGGHDTATIINGMLNDHSLKVDTV
ncbi:VCBS repeat-containing protein [Pseudomonas sp. GGS8]|uniref:retention module-containing protein n=1 Tax=Pseudomonas sp. GGS8 TaxID=2817892 RepID=UPI00209E06D4|nr:retention module-containing protein [Pseudomonas sp. GGS8]MCP1444036.1 VCBS repeat-containing protein [Pseudomonas sp. GGS8]